MLLLVSRKIDWVVMVGFVIKARRVGVVAVRW